MLISVDQLEESAKRYTAVQPKASRGKPSDFREEVSIDNVPPSITVGNILTPTENLVKRKEMLATLQQEPVDFAFERAIGKNDSVYSNFVEIIRNSKQKVGRIAIKNGNRNIGFATGFMVADNLLLTNWHVFKTIEQVADSEIQFFYEYNTLGNPEAPISFKIQSDIFYHSNKELDYCFVAVNPVDISGTKRLKDIGYIFLDPTLGKLGREKQEALNIIHHPDGDYMQLSIRENLFVKITPISVWYRTDTAPGSSGSPVFNDQWQVVALHHMGIGKKNEAGQYIDKTGKAIEEINGEIDTSKIVWEANEGIRISVILKDLFANVANNALINGLKVQPLANTNFPEKISALPDNALTSNNDSKKSSMEPNNITNAVKISFPASLLEKNGVVNISINQGEYVAPIKPVAQTPSTPTVEESDAEEIKKVRTDA